MHHIIGDANSLILLIKIIALMQGNNTGGRSNNMSQNQTIELDLSKVFN